MLTKKQYQLLMFIDSRLKVVGVSPSFEEMKVALNLKSKSGIHRLITGLEERGFIRRLPYRARALEVLKLPENTLISGRNVVTQLNASSEAKFKKHYTTETGVVDLPLYGKIAAGTPVEALRDPSQTIGVPAFMLGRGEHYTLDIDVDYMNDSAKNDKNTDEIER